MEHPISGRLLLAGFALAASMTVCAGSATNPSLRDELLAMRARDQVARQTTIQVFKSEEAFQQWSRREDTDRRRLKEIVEQHGWPTISMVGVNGAEAAWLTAQHSDDDKNFQLQVLELIAPLVETGEADPK